MDDERLKNPPGKGQKDYFDEQLEWIRDIRSVAGKKVRLPEDPNGYHEVLKLDRHFNA